MGRFLDKVGLTYYHETVKKLLRKKSNKSKVISETLLASNWVGDNAPYSYTLELSDVTSNTVVELATPSSITEEQIDAYKQANLLNSEQADGSITIYAWGKMPEIDLPVTVIIRGDV